jgi:hypothetical protein
MKTPRWRHFAQNLISIVLSAVVALGLSEGVVRILGHEDELNQYHVGDRMIPPCAPLDIRALKQHVDSYYHDDPFLVYSAHIGWDIAPSHLSQEGYQSNSDGLRADLEYETEVEEGVIRIGVFGDSYSFGVDAPYKESWPYLLQIKLNDAGYKTEVINFGVPAYGMDQAYLRYVTKGKLYNLDIVIFGLNPENANRNVNILSPFYFGTSFPFSKPRFVVNNKTLALINSPTQKPSDLLETFKRFDESPLAKYEEFYDGRRNNTILWKSRLAALTSTFIGVECGMRGFTSTPLYNADQSLSRNIVKKFGESVEEQSSQFIILEIAISESVKSVIDGGTAFYDEFYVVLTERYPVIRTVDKFVKENHTQYFSKSRHHSPLGQSRVADIVFDYLSKSNILLSGTILGAYSVSGF